MARIEVLPKGGKWEWRQVGDDGATNTTRGGIFDTRREAIDDARKSSGGTNEPLYREDGTPAGALRATGMQIVLLRADGTMHGELDPPPSTGGTPQFVSIKPATELANAQALKDKGIKVPGA